MIELVVLLPCLLVVAGVAWARRAEEKKEAARRAAAMAGDQDRSPRA